MGDFDGDGNFDVAVVAGESNDLFTLIGKGNGTFEASPIGYKAGSVRRATTAMGADQASEKGLL